MLFHSGLSPSASWRTVSTIRYMMFSSTLQKPGQLNPGAWDKLRKQSAPRARGEAGATQTTSRIHVAAPHQHTGTGGKGLCKSNQENNLLSQILLLSYPQPVSFLLCRLSTMDTSGNSQSWDSSRTPSSACLSLPKLPENPGPPLCPPIPTAYLRSVLSAREMAGFLTALEQAALLLRRENSSEGIWESSNSVTGTPRASATP